jgi:hypothetical protein
MPTVQVHAAVGSSTPTATRLLPRPPRLFLLWSISGRHGVVPVG